MDGLVRLLGCDLSKPYQYLRVAEAMVELGLEAEALRWARAGIDKTSGWQVGKLYDLIADLLDQAGDAAGVLAVRQEHHDRYGVGTDTAAALLVAAGDNPERLRSEAAWAHLCGASPIQASSGKTVRHRLNRSGDRQANHALWRIAMVRMSHDPRTRDYVARRLEEGKTKREIMRILKRYIAREVYKTLPRD